MNPEAPRVCLQFLSGRLEGGVVPLRAGRPLLVGRQPGADLLVAEELVSRRHALVAFDGRDVIVEDLGSTNGSFVNGARVTRARVGEGDRVRIGETIFTVVHRDRQPSSAAVTQLQSLVTQTQADDGPASAIQGRLEEVPLIDVLQLLAAARKTGVLSIRSASGDALVTLEAGAVIECSLAGHRLASDKALFRIVEWRSGQFELAPRPPNRAAPPPLLPSIDALVMEAARQLDEMPRLRAGLPSRFEVTDEVPLVALEPDDRALVDLAARLGDLDAVLESTPLPDLVAAERLAALHTRGILVDAHSPRSPA